MNRETKLTLGSVVVIGAIPATIMPAEWYESLSRGTINGIPSCKETIVPYKLFEVAKYASFDGGAICALPIEINLDTWNSLPPEVQNAFNEDDFLREAQRKFVEIWNETWERDKKTMSEGGIQWIKVDPAEQEQLYDTYKKIAIQVVPEAMAKAGVEKEGVMFLDQIYQKSTGHDLAWWKNKLGLS